MERSNSETLHMLKERGHLSRRLFFEGLIVGALAGLIAIIYRLLLTNAEGMSHTFQDLVFRKLKLKSRDRLINAGIRSYLQK